MNVGDSTILPSTQNVILTQIISDSSSIDVGTYTISGLGMGRVDQPFTLTPQVTNFFPKGKYFVAVPVDALQTILESDEHNLFFTDNADINIPSPNLRRAPSRARTGTT